MSARKDWMLGSFVPVRYASSRAAKTSAARKAISGTEAAAAVFQGSARLRIVGQFAEFAKTAGSCVPLQSVYGAPQAAGRFHIARSYLQAHRFIVQFLDEFSRALEEQLAEVAHPIIRSVTHALTSIRWYAVPLWLWSI